MTAAGADYTLEVLPGVDHAMPHIAAAVQAREGITLARKVAVFFGLARG